MTADHSTSASSCNCRSLTGVLRALAVPCLVLLAVRTAAAIDPAQPGDPLPAFARRHLADYDSEPRGADGRVDREALLARLKQLGVTTYYWLIWHAPTDWDDLKLFLPQARAAGINIWVYLVPPTESPPIYGHLYSEPFRLDYQRWAEEIARLSLEHPNLTAWVIDDFYANHEFFTPDVIQQMQQAAKPINPRLAFLPLMYFDELRTSFVADYREVIDGVVVAYLHDREEIDWAWAILNDAEVCEPGELSFPWNTPSQTGDFCRATQTAEVLPADKHVVRFRERDDFTAQTCGYHFKQLLVDDTVVWQQDVAEGTPAWQPIEVDVSRYVQGKSAVRLSFQLKDERGVSNFGVRWRIDQLAADGLRLAGDVNEPSAWQSTSQGAFASGFGSQRKVGQRRFHIPLISMTAATVGDYRTRHGEPATPQAVADLLRVSFGAWHDGKCDGVVTYCLDKGPDSLTFPVVQQAFGEAIRQSPTQRPTAGD